MEELTSKERYMRMFQGEPIDRIPVCPRVFENVVFEYFNTRDINLVEGSIEYYRHFGLDIIDWNCTPHFEFEDFDLEGPNWKPTLKDEDSGTTKYEIVTVKTPRGELRRVIAVTKTGKWEQERAITEYPIKSERDFDLIAEYMPPAASMDTSSIKRAIELIGDDGITSPSLDGPFNIIACCYQKLEDLLMHVTLSPDFYHRMMEYFLDRLFSYAQQMIDAGGSLFDIGANVANARLVSPNFLAEHIMPYENRLADFIQDQGVLCLYHNCGYAAKHLEVYPQLHHRAWGYLAPEPHGDTVLEEAIEKLPREMILWGHLDQIDFLRKASPKEIEERVKYICETVKARGNYILGTTDYLEVNTPPENINALVDAGHKYGSYGD